MKPGPNRFREFLKLDAKMRWLKQNYPWQFNLLALAIALSVFGIVMLLLFFLEKIRWH